MHERGGEMHENQQEERIGKEAVQAPQLAGKRLNASGGAEEVVARWAAGNVLYALRPGDGAVVAGADLPAGSLAEPPRPTPAARPARLPFRLHRVRRH